uniref:ribonuclease H n=1 Tax=Sinocyclocheilus anshuiensis TaxID=1608454 RepID=A0A671SLU3_9TELE
MANLGGRLVNILIDTGAACSCTNISLPLSTRTIQIKGIGDTVKTATQTQPIQLDLGMVVLKEPFWYLPGNGEGTVLGMDIMQKHGFVIHCFEKQIELQTNKTTKNCLLQSTASIMSISNTDPIQLLINKYSDICANHEDDCGLIDFEVCIKGEPPPPQKQFRIKSEDQTAVHEMVQELEKRGIVQRCCSTTNSPCLLVPKPNGKWHLCIDSQRLNKVLPKATPIVANPATISTNALWFTVLDIKNGFWSIKGLHNSPAIFHRAVANALGPGEVVHYVDDILIATEGSLENHLQLVDKVLQILGKAGIKMNKEKAQIAQKEVHYLGQCFPTGVPRHRLSRAVCRPSVESRGAV